MFNLSRIQIKGLYNIRDYNILFENNRLIMVGENGSGKTTIIKIIYAALSCNWDVLRTYAFDEIVMTINKKNIIIKSTLLNRIFSLKGIERLDYAVERRTTRRTAITDNLLETVITLKRQLENKPTDIVDVDSIYIHRVPYEYIQEIINHPDIKELYDLTKQIEEAFKEVKLLYLPTYRRIEEQLSTVFPEADKEEWERARRRLNKSRSTELVEFGMQDVEQAVKEYQNNLKALSQEQQSLLTLGYLSEIVSSEYDHVDINTIRELSTSEINEVLSRIETRILSQEKKAKVLSMLMEVRSDTHENIEVLDKIVCHYFLKLLVFHRDITNAEVGIRTFQDICNKYLINNIIYYDSQNFACHVNNVVKEDRQPAKEIRFQNLSSGEKQIVSVFSYLNLNREKSVFVIIDEPELSLAVDWQKSFLVDIIASSSCCGLMATTHSPFIFANDLDGYVHGINEFCTRG